MLPELAQLSGVAAILRFPVPDLLKEDEDGEEDEEDDSDSDSDVGDSGDNLEL